MKTLSTLFFLTLNLMMFGQEYVSNQLIIKVKDTYSCTLTLNRTGISELDQILSNHGIKKVELLVKSKPKREMKNRPNTDNLLLLTFEQADITVVRRELLATEKLENAEFNAIGMGGGVQLLTPNDANFGNQWSLYNDGTFNANAVAGADIKMKNAWDFTTGNSSTVVAILDSGLKLDHPEFAGRIWANNDPSNGVDDDNNGYVDDFRGWDFVNSDNNPTDDHGHGTNVTGILAATGNNNIGYAGINWACQIMALKILDNNNSGFYSWWIPAIYYAIDNGAEVLNMSVGGSSFSSNMEAAINYGAANDVITVACMMNFNNATPYYPAAFGNAIAVGATDTDDSRVSPFFWSSTSGSNYGPHIELVAPGNYMYGLAYNSNTNYGTYWGGTSQSAPLVAGVVSLMKGLDPSISLANVRTYLHQSGEDQVGPSSEDTQGWDVFFGHGRMNANQALLNMVNVSTEPVFRQAAVRVFPNPTTNVVTVESDENMLEINIFDINGRPVLHQPMKGNQINLTDLANGVYFLKVKTERGGVVRKVIKE